MNKTLLLILLLIVFSLSFYFTGRWHKQNYISRTEYESLRQDYGKLVEEKNKLSKQVDSQEKEEIKAQTLTDCAVEAREELLNLDWTNYSSVEEINQIRKLFLENCLNLRGYDK